MVKTHTRVTDIAMAALFDVVTMATVVMETLDSTASETQ